MILPDVLTIDVNQAELRKYRGRWKAKSKVTGETLVKQGMLGNTLGHLTWKLSDYLLYYL